MKIEVEVSGGVMQFKQMPDGFKDGLYEVSINNIDLRSQAQNKSLWLWMQMIANVLNTNNVPITQIIKADVHWDKDKVKLMFWNPVMKVLFDKESSTKLNKPDFDLIIMTMTKAFGMRGVTLPEFPSIEGKENARN